MASALVLLPVVFGLYFYNLNGVGLLGPDEPRYVAIGRAMAESGDWVTPKLWGTPWFEKPALLYWLVAIGTKLGLSIELAGRLPVAILCTLFFALFWRVTSREFGGDIATYACLILGTSAGWVAYSQLALTDLPMAAAFTIAMLFFVNWFASEERNALWWAGVAMGVAVLAKGLVPLGLALPVLWFGRGRLRELWRAALACFLVAGPWYIACYAANGWRFIDVFIIQHHLGRFTDGALQHTQPFWFYAPVLLVGLLPWTPSLAALADPDSYIERRTQFLAAWLGFGFLLFSAASNKLPGYLLPLLPAAAILIAVWLSEQRPGSRWALAAGGLLLGIAPVAAAVLPVALTRGITHVQWPQEIPAGIGLGVLVGGWVWYRDAVSGRVTALVVLALASALSIVYVKRMAYPVLDRDVSARGLFRAIADRQDQICFGSMNRSWRYGLYAYWTGKTPPTELDCEVTPRKLQLEERGDGPPRLWFH
jgi:4-amino-4-deoxy-L-arabinose transferase-like glycosyltransferase